MKHGIAAFVIFATTSLGALAHSKKEGTTPIDGALLSTPPEVIGMVFDDPMRITMVKLTNADGLEYEVKPNQKLTPSLKFEAAPEPLTPGHYTVEWRGLSSDGHAMQGRFTFVLTE